MDAAPYTRSEREGEILPAATQRLVAAGRGPLTAARPSRIPIRLARVAQR